MSLPKLAARVILGYVGLVEGTAALIRFRERSTAFQMAAERATALGRRLVVVGDPDAGMHTRLMRAYGCGDVCIDMNGCPGCPITIVADPASCRRSARRRCCRPCRASARRGTGARSGSTAARSRRTRSRRFLAEEAVSAVSDTNAEQALEIARAEARTLADQLRQARADLHRLGIADQNRALVCAAVCGALGILCRRRHRAEYS